MMTPSRTFLIFAVFALASLSFGVNAQCLRNIDGILFNLCPLETPVNISINADYYSVNFTFGIAKPNVPECDNSDASGWFRAEHSRAGCVGNIKPVLSIIEKYNRVTGLMIDYPLGNGNSYALRIICDQTAPRDGNINFEFDNIYYDRTMAFKASSYYGCPAETGCRNFLQN